MTEILDALNGLFRMTMIRALAVTLVLTAVIYIYYYNAGGGRRG